jgi:hypothetical protein
MLRDESGSIQEGGNVKSKDATPSRDPVKLSQMVVEIIEALS